MSSQRFSNSDPKYIKHPPAESGWLSDGDSFDAGSAMIISNNLAHLQYESCKHLVNCTGDVYPPQDDASNWTGVNDEASVADPDSQIEEIQIAWTRKTSLVFGPFSIPQDREISDGRKALRKVVVYVGTYNGSGTALKLYCYLTPNKNSPAYGYLAKKITTTSTLGKEYNRIVLEADTPSIENFPIPTENGNTQQIRQVYLWVGFKMPTGSDLLSVSAFESR
jgi:hypothetical protein